MYSRDFEFFDHITFFPPMYGFRTSGNRTCHLGLINFYNRNTRPMCKCRCVIGVDNLVRPLFTVNPGF